MAEEFSWNFPKYMYIVRNGFSENQEISAKSRLNSDNISSINEVWVSLIDEKFGKNSRTDMLDAGNIPYFRELHAITAYKVMIRNYEISLLL